MAETNWITLTGANLGEVLDLTIIDKATQNIGADANPNSKVVDYDSENRRDRAVATAVAEVRAAISNSGRVPISTEQGTVPPEAHAHVLFLAAWRIINSTPNLNMAILTEKGVSTPYAQFYKDAQEYLKCAAEGLRVTPPSSPAGQDDVNPVSDTNPPVNGVSWSDEAKSDDEYNADPTIALKNNMTTD